MFALDHMVASLITALHLSILDTIIVYKGASARFIAYHLGSLSVLMRILHQVPPAVFIKSLFQHRCPALPSGEYVGKG